MNAVSCEYGEAFIVKPKIRNEKWVSSFSLPSLQNTLINLSVTYLAAESEVFL